MADRYDWERDREHRERGPGEFDRGRDWDYSRRESRRGEWDRERHGAESNYGGDWRQEGRYGEGRYGDWNQGNMGRENRGPESWGREDWRREQPWSGENRSHTGS